MVVDNVVEGSVDPVVDVQGLKVVDAAFASVDLGHDAGGGADEEPAWFGNEPGMKYKRLRNILRRHGEKRILMLEGI